MCTSPASSSTSRRSVNTSSTTGIHLHSHAHLLQPQVVAHHPGNIMAYMQDWHIPVPARSTTYRTLPLPSLPCRVVLDCPTLSVHTSFASSLIAPSHPHICSLFSYLLLILVAIFTSPQVETLWLFLLVAWLFAMLWFPLFPLLNLHLLPLCFSGSLSTLRLRSVVIYIRLFLLVISINKLAFIIIFSSPLIHMCRPSLRWPALWPFAW